MLSSVACASYRGPAAEAPPLRGTSGPEAISSSLLLQALAIRAVSVNVLQHFLQRFAITKDGERVHYSPPKARVVESARQVQHGFHVEGLRKHVHQVRLLDPKTGF